MKSAALFFVLAMAFTGTCIAYPANEHNEKDTEANALKQEGRALETLGQILQGKDTPMERRALLAELASQLGAFHGTDYELDEKTSEYFFKLIRRIVGNVAKAVVINKAVGAVAGMIG
ncbi:uncharacterized protein [Dermacentor albipictus]|uniref:uncharacterized protein n=1 Tax=Dermacentor albipictus TaxID=60249 RepID=UPI0031FC1B33